MNNPFTIEESNLIAVYNTTDRQAALDALFNSVQYLDDKDMIALTYQTIDKLSHMSNEEFKQLQITPVQDEE